MAQEHDHGVRVVKCAGCGRERWCGIGPCFKCGEFTPCPDRAPQLMPGISPERIRAATRLLQDSGDITPQGARILNQICDDTDTRTETP